MTLAKIIIEDIVVTGILGAYAPERVTPQKIIINIVLWVDISRAAVSDALEDAVNYDELVQMVIAHVQQARAYLIERLVSELADLVLHTHTAVEKVTIRVDKPDVLPQVRTVGVELTRQR